MNIEGTFTEEKSNHALAFVIMLAAAILLIWTAWINDDAYISFRVIDNFFNGHGLRWNTFERVQAYSHPLWLLLLIITNCIVPELFYATIVLSFLISMTVILGALSRARDSLQALTIAVLLLSSKAFLDYSSSGLENPLTHLLLAGLAWELLVLRPRIKHEKHVFYISALSGLSHLSRPDAIVLFLPALVLTLWKAWKEIKWKIFRPLLLGFSPIFAWFAFSFFYYGFPFPNTAYAKLGSGVPSLLLIKSGAAYLWNSLKWDTLSLTCIAIVSVQAFRFKLKYELALVAGSLLYLIYILSIGGDFMSGRFISAPFYLAILCLPSLISGKKVLGGLLCIALVSSLANPHSFFSPFPVSQPNLRGLFKFNDTRRFFSKNTSLFAFLKAGGHNNHEFARRGKAFSSSNKRLTKSVAIGMFGYMAGPEKRIIDLYALSDPLLARLPIPNPRKWRIGHFRRKIPNGYESSIESLENHIEEPALKDYYQKLTFITRGPLLSWDRLRTALAFNLGRYEHLKDNYVSSSMSSAK